ncbi:MAG: virulence factor BrkB family protein [Gammaproteobacteria bacterium]|nr:virulence factor BrkB family protein [Gammaproteobacteria bacterium]
MTNNKEPMTNDKLRRIGQFSRFLLSRLVEDKCLQTAANLSYTSMLSLVPLAAVIFSVFTAFPVFQAMEADIRDFIFSNFVPASGETVQAYFQTFIQQTAKLTAVGIGFLILTALLMLKTIDSALNTIWRAKKRRNAVRRFMVYWSILTLGPILIGVGIFVSSYLISLPLFSDVEQGTWKRLLAWLPFLTTASAFTLLYILIPNCAVPWRLALTGGLLAALLFEAAKKGFAVYVTHSDVYETIYGALATIPIFLVWIYVSWIIILLGAEITYCLTIFKRTGKAAGTEAREDKFVSAYRLLGHLWLAQCEGKSLTIEKLLALENRHDEICLSEQLETLEAAQWVCLTETGQWLLSRDLGETALLDLHRLVSRDFSADLGDDAWDLHLRPLLLKLNSHADEVMNLPLKTLYKP